MRLSKSSSRRLYVAMAAAVILVSVFVGRFDILRVAGGDGDWWNTDFAYRLKIIFNNSQISENLVNFPVPIVINSSNTDFWSHAQTNGNDTRFVFSDNQTELYYELEQFNSTSKNMVAWVKTNITAGSTTDFIWIYYGNSTANFDSYRSSNNVWDSSYNGVWHLNQTSGTQNDSTSNGWNSLALSLTQQGSATGKLDGADQFNGVNTYVRFGNLVESSNFTVAFWMKPTITTGWRSTVMKEYDYGLQFDPQGRLWATVNDGSWTSGYKGTSLSCFTPNVWHYVSMCWDNTNYKVYLYVNGSTICNSTSESGAHVSNTNNLRLGSWDEAIEYFNGTIDEVSISNTFRSVNWIEACYQYEVDQSKFTYGSEESWVPAKLYINPPLLEKGPSDIGTTFNLNVTVQNVRDLWSFDFNLTWNNTLLTLVSVDYSTTLDNMWGPSKWSLANETYGVSYYQLAAASTSDSFNNTGSTSLATLEFKVEISNIASQTPIHFDAHKLTDSQSRPIIHSTEDGTYRIAGKTPTLEMNPAFKTCRKCNETFTIKINVSDAGNVKDFSFGIFYNSTLLDYANIAWNAWSSGSVTIDEVNGNITGSTSGSAISGNLTLVAIEFSAKYHHIWKDLAGWTNNLTGTICLQWANLSYPGAPDLRYEKGRLNEISVGPDVVYTFSPIKGDVNNDGHVDLFDIRTVAAFYDTVNPDYNLTGDSIVDIYDLVIIGSNFGYTYP
jgi:hypothetical protein